MKNNKKANTIIIILSVIVALLVSVLTRVTLKGAENLPWNVKLQPALHAILNSLTAISLMIGYVAIRLKKVKLHRIMMFFAVGLSGVFLVSYVTYHGLTDPTRFGGEGMAKIIYSFILITHIVLAAVIFPLILMTVHRAMTNQIILHKKLAAITFPIWLYVAVTGVLVYILLSPYYG